MFASAERRPTTANTRSIPSPKTRTTSGRSSAWRSASSAPSLWHGMATGLRLSRPAVSQPGDAAELEADRVADAVLRGNRVSVGQPAGAAVHRLCAACEGEPPQDDEARVHARRESAGPAFAAADPTPTGAGQALPEALRAEFEPRFGSRFDDVRLHTGASAARSAQQLQARAYTYGRDLVFGAGEYAPTSARGRHLIAHELTHVVQQSRGGAAPMLQRKGLGGPLDLQPDVCVSVPWLSDPACASKAADICAATPGLPGCTAVCKVFDCHKPNVPKTACPDGWRAAGSKNFAGQCCRGGIDSAQACCAPDRIAPKDQRCCGPDETVSDQQCVKTKDLPPQLPGVLCPAERLTPRGDCCVPPMVLDGLRCTFRQINPPKPPDVPDVPDPPKAVAPLPFDIFFRFDRPHAGEPASALGAAATGAGKANFDALVKRLKADPTLQVQLTGRASPPGADSYNLDLGDRRARMLASALASAGVGGARIADPPDATLGDGCTQLGVGLVSCGETGATGEADQEVRARLFQRP